MSKKIKSSVKRERMVPCPAGKRGLSRTREIEEFVSSENS